MYGITWPGKMIRLSILMNHYTQLMYFSEHDLGQAVNALNEFNHFSEIDPEILPAPEFMDAICDDLNTPRAVTELHRLVKVARAGPFAVAIKPGATVPLMSDDGG